jgi:hypothetical protein
VFPGASRPGHRQGDRPPVHQVAALETVKDHLKPIRQPSVEPRHQAAEKVSYELLL